MIAILIPAIALALLAATVLAQIPILHTVDVIATLLTTYAIRRVRWSGIVWSAIIAGVIAALVAGEPLFARPLVYLAGLTAGTRVFPHYRSDPRRVDALGIAACMAVAATIIAVLLLGRSVVAAWPSVVVFAMVNTAVGLLISWLVFPRMR